MKSEQWIIAELKRVEATINTGSKRAKNIIEKKRQGHDHLFTSRDITSVFMYGMLEGNRDTLHKILETDYGREITNPDSESRPPDWSPEREAAVIAAKNLRKYAEEEDDIGNLSTAHYYLNEVMEILEKRLGNFKTQG